MPIDIPFRYLDQVVLVVGGGAMQVPAVEAARRAGFRVAVSDRNPAAAAMALADYPLVVDVYDWEGLVRAIVAASWAGDLKGVLTMAADVEVTVAEVAHHFGLSGLAPAAARICKNKALMRTILDLYRLNGPIRFQVVRWGGLDSTGLAGAAWQAWARWRGLACIVKPADQSASRGITVLRAEHTEAELEAALQRAAAASLRHPDVALIETYLEGAQYSVEVVLPPGDAKAIFLNAVLRPFEGVVELGHINPAPLTEAGRAALLALAERVGRAVGVTGIFKLDVIWPEGGEPVVLECTARLSGGWDSSHTTPLATGRDFAALALYLAVTPEPTVEAVLNFARARIHRQWAACATIFLPPGHRVVLLTPEDEWARWRAKPGDVIGPVGDCGERAGFAFAVASDPFEAWRLALQHAEHLSRSVRLEAVE